MCMKFRRQYTIEPMDGYHKSSFRGLQQGFTNYSCYFCPWGSRATGEHYEKM